MSNRGQVLSVQALVADIRNAETVAEQIKILKPPEALNTFRKASWDELKSNGTTALFLDMVITKEFETLLIPGDRVSPSFSPFELHTEQTFISQENPKALIMLYAVAHLAQYADFALADPELRPVLRRTAPQFLHQGFTMLSIAPRMRSKDILPELQMRMTLILDRLLKAFGDEPDLYVLILPR